MPRQEGYVAVYGGSFDPPHKSHLNIIDIVAKTDWISKIIVVPSGGHLIDYVKAGKSSYDVRLAWTKAMVDDMDETIRNRVEISDIERQGALDGLGVVLALENRGKLSLSTAVLVVGSDYADSLHTWCSDPRWMEMRFMINLREGENADHVRATMMAEGWLANQLEFFSAGSLSSSDVKRTVFEATVLTKSIEDLQDKAASLSRIPKIVHARYRTEPDPVEVDVLSNAKELETRAATIRDELNTMMPASVLESLECDDDGLMNMLACGYKERKPKDAKNFETSIDAMDDLRSVPRWKTAPGLIEVITCQRPVPDHAG